MFSLCALTPDTPDSWHLDRCFEVLLTFSLYLLYLLESQTQLRSAEHSRRMSPYVAVCRLLSLQTEAVELEAGPQWLQMFGVFVCCFTQCGKLQISSRGSPEMSILSGSMPSWDILGTMKEYERPGT